MKDRETRESKGVAFILYVERGDALKAVEVMNGKLLNKRRLKVCLATDNGRTREFIKRREYKDKSRCYECGDGGHLSYECPRNQLGPREQPVAKRKRRGRGGASAEGGREGESHGQRQKTSLTGRVGASTQAEAAADDNEEEDEEEDGARFEYEGWASVVAPRYGCETDTSIAQDMTGGRTVRAPSLKGPRQQRG
eukprot:TRINITY_DN10224_c0_g1_i1.p1 TRINITY_DN10224_c0_g1~~TRINITY_DN10224_c0_g1_i1.p1  ORF type:complete len:195 (-),score=39.72 TRINITY_DN10224_c0_g1_i1:79-663(-)